MHTRHEALVLSNLRDHGPCALRDLAVDSGLNLGQLRYALVRPMEEGLVVMDSGQGARTTGYRLAPR